MCYYVEYLRATRALRIVAIVLGVVLLGALVLRLSWGAPTKPATVHDYYYVLEHSKTAHVARKRLPNGNTRTIVDDPKKEVYAIIERHGSSVVEFTFAHTREAAEDQLHSGAPRAHELTSTGPGVSWASGAFTLGGLFGMTIPMGLLVATLLAGPFSKENSGHLEVAWTKPVSRERYALTAVLVDVSTLTVAQVATAVALVLAAWFWGPPTFGVERVAALLVATAWVAPIAWYAFLTGLSASAKRGPGVALGIGWVVAIVVPSIAAATHEATTPVGRSVHAIFDALAYLIPLSYVWGRVDAGDAARSLAIGVSAMAALAVVYLGLALAQWRRLEA